MNQKIFMLILCISCPYSLGTRKCNAFIDDLRSVITPFRKNTEERGDIFPRHSLSSTKLANSLRVCGLRFALCVHFFNNLYQKKYTVYSVIACTQVPSISSIFEVVFRKRVRRFHQVSKREKTFETTRLQAQWFYCFRAFGNLMKPEARVFEITSPTKKISSNYHFNEFSGLNSNILFQAWILSPTCSSVI